MVRKSILTLSAIAIMATSGCGTLGDTVQLIGVCTPGVSSDVASGAGWFLDFGEDMISSYPDESEPWMVEPECPDCHTDSECEGIED